MEIRPVARLENIVKVYPDGVKALDGVSLEVYPSEILGILGENGAGKTTLMRIFYGEIKPTHGRIYINDKQVYFNGPWDAIRHGIRMIYQQFSMVETFTGLENIHLFLTSMEKNISFKETEKRVKELLKSLGFNIPINEPVEDLPIGIQQKLEIVKALVSGAKILILDEPTSLLNPLEVMDLFKLIKRLKENRVSVIFISHKLREVKGVTDRVVVLRKGKVVGEAKTSEIDEASLARMMIGNEVVLSSRRVEKISIQGEKSRVLILENIVVKSDREQSSLKDLSLVLFKGEILGVAGIQGNGQIELAEVILGLRKPVKGRIILEGEDITNLPVSERLKKGIAYIPDSRRHGLVLDMDILENVLLTNHMQAVNRFGIIMTRTINNLANKVIKEYNVIASSPKILVKHLSGGNQQRVLVGRELVKNPKVLIALEPTQGLDVGSTHYVRNLLINHKLLGGSVLLISSDLEELLSLSDRLAIIYCGKIVAEGLPSEFSIEKLGLCMGGSC